MAEKLSNVIGAPFPDYVLDQLYTRAARNSTTNRTNDEILFLANKTAWVRLISSVNISLEGDLLKAFYKNLGVGSYGSEDDLAKNWILQAGTSQYAGNGISLRSGFGENGAYGLGGTGELGYRPMPGLNGVTIDTAGTLGSLRIADIRFQVWNMNQLNVIEALYFRLGYSMLLEWGHTQFFITNNKFETATNTFGIDNPFGSGVDKVIVQQSIARKSKQLGGNYDGMLAIVSNFTWSMNQEGGYDCTVKLIGLGSILDTMRINQSYKMPPGLLKQFKKNQEALEAEKKRKDLLVQQQEEKRLKQEAAKTAPPKVPNNPSEIYTVVYKSDFGDGTLTPSEAQFLQEQAYYTSYQSTEDAPNFIPDYYYKATLNKNTSFQDSMNRESTGLFLNKNNKRGFWSFVPADVSLASPQPVLLNGDLIDYNAGWYYNTGNALASLVQDTAAVLDFRGELDDNPYIEATIGTSQNIIRALRGGTGGRYQRDSTAESAVGKYFDIALASNELANTDDVTVRSDIGATGISRKAVNFNTVTKPFSLYYVYYAPTPLLNGTGEAKKPFYFFVNFTLDPSVTYTPAELIKAVDSWFIQKTPKANIISIAAQKYTDEDNVVFNDIIIKAIPADITIPNKPTPQITIVFNNTTLITAVLPRTLPTTPPTNATQQANAGDTSGAENQPTTTQTDAASGYQSALHVVLTYIKTTAEAQAINSKYQNYAVIKVDILEATNSFYKDGVFKNVITATPPTALEFQKATTAGTFNLTAYAQRGFNSNLMLNPELYSSIDPIDFKELSTAYLVQYQLSSTSDYIDYPVYINFGYLLAFLNNMCLIYDSRQAKGSDKTPYVYIDFDPNNNFCLTSPQHLSIDPTICLIPFQGTDAAYLSIFPEDIAKSFATAFKPKTEDYLSASLPKFKTNNAYQGKIMNILLNVDYLLKLATNFATSDPDHSVNLKGFLDIILVDVNKCLGTQNMFRAAYRDDTNTVQIKDDQWVPGRAEEPTALNQSAYAEVGQAGRLGQLPIFGQQSLVRSMQFKTNLSTKLSSMIAISAQAATGSVNSTDPSSLSHLNQNYYDRFKPHIKDASEPPSGADSQNKTNQQTSKTDSENDRKIADQFNEHVKGIYSNFNLDIAKIETAKNYYIERISKVKSTNPVTTAAPFIPADLEITIDGVAGIVMGNAFTIPENRLPLSLRGTDAAPKVGFIVAGLTHTIQDNEWLTKIRGQMIKLRGNLSNSAVAEINQRQKTLGQASAGGSTSNTPCGCTRCYEGSNPPDKDGKNGYSCADQVLPPNYVGTDNFTTYYPGYVFNRGVSDIKVTNPLTEAEIVDDTRQNRFNIGKLNTPASIFVIHHTGGHNGASGTYRTFYGRGLPAQYVIDRQGRIHRFLPDGALGWHAGPGYNGRSLGVEVEAFNDKDVLPVQVEAAVRLANYLGFKKSEVVGHGEISTNKEPTEGKTIVDRIRSGK